jgi:hypothetical protein
MRRLTIGWGSVLVACGVAGPAGAVHHRSTHHSSTHHAASHHESAHHKASSAHHASPKHRDDRKPAAAAGATTVPASGIKLFCGPGRSPLMVRKMTQGAGTTVTVICR